MKHEIFRQLGYIQQTLSQNKKPIGIFLAAGCPLAVRVNHRSDIETQKEESDPIIQDVAGLTRVILERLNSGNSGAPSNCDRLVLQMLQDGVLESNIELILSQIRALKQVVGKGTVKEFTSDELDCLDKGICEIIFDQVDKPLLSFDTPYHHLASWARALERDKPVNIFTTNYDLLMEQAMEDEGCPYFDGFIGARNAFFDLRTVENENLLNSGWSRLWKIHGSINWRIDERKNVVRSDQKDSKQSYLIYPSHLKYDQSRKMPYLAMLDRLKAFILAPSSALFIVGYSFSDDHINDVILQSLRSNATAIVYAFLYGKLEQTKYNKAIQCAKATSNLNVIAFDKGIIGRKTGTWFLKEAGKSYDIPGNIVKLFKAQEEVNGENVEVDKVEFQLGDFELFGNFLRDISANEITDETFNK
ncbi:MAG TPA: SIR2 family protein [Cytophagaceae bacterium]|jgi:hypothetical protein